MLLKTQILENPLRGKMKFLTHLGRWSANNQHVKTIEICQNLLTYFYRLMPYNKQAFLQQNHFTAHMIFTIILWGRLSPSFPYRWDNGAQRGQVTCPSSHSHEVVELRLGAWSLDRSAIVITIFKKWVLFLNQKYWSHKHLLNVFWDFQTPRWMKCLFSESR